LDAKYGTVGAKTTIPTNSIVNIATGPSKVSTLKTTGSVQAVIVKKGVAASPANTVKTNTPVIKNGK
jgi:hypothetical protein